jgi:integrase
MSKGLVPLVGDRVPIPADDRQPHPSDLTWDRAIDAWLLSLDSEATQRNYKTTIKHLFGTSGMPALLCEVTIENLEAWRGAMVARSQLPANEKMHLATATVNRNLAAARSFFTHWRDKSKMAAWHIFFTGDTQKRALKSVKGNVEHPYAILTNAEMSAMIDASTPKALDEKGKEHLARKTWQAKYEGKKESGLAQRDAAIITTALATGLRCAELAALNVGDLVQETFEVIEPGEDGKPTKKTIYPWFLEVRAGKGNKDRRLTLADDDAQMVLDYIASTGRKHGRIDAESPLWLTGRERTDRRERGGRLATNHIRRIINAAADRAQAAGLIRSGKAISPHSLRHSFAINVYRGDPEHGRRAATVMEVKELLGHASIATTQRYLAHEDEVARVGLAPNISRMKQQPAS